MEQPNFDFDLITVTGFGDKGVKELVDKLNTTIAPKSSTILQGCPWYRALENPDNIIERICSEIDKISPEQMVLIGHSYGAIIALAVAMRLKMKNILKLILIDGPLNPHVDVKPTKFAHQLFQRQYNQRVELADKCEQALKSQGSANIVSICGQNDRIVPFEAKFLPGPFTYAPLEMSKDVSPLQINDRTSINLVLPDRFRGHGLTHKIPYITSQIDALVNGTAKEKPETKTTYS